MDLNLGPLDYKTAALTTLPPPLPKLATYLTLTDLRLEIELRICEETLFLMLLAENHVTKIYRGVMPRIIQVS